MGRLSKFQVATVAVCASNVTALLERWGNAMSWWDWFIFIGGILYIFLAVFFPQSLYNDAK